MTFNARQFSAAVRELEAIPSRVAANAARKISAEIQLNFDKGLDPYGVPWKPLAASTIAGGRHPPPLTKTRAGRDSVTVRPASGAGLSIRIGKKYMIYHQHGGASHLRGPGGSFRARKRNKRFGTSADQSAGRASPPQRAFLPFDEMPARWIELYQEALNEELAQTRIGRAGGVVRRA